MPQEQFSKKKQALFLFLFSFRYDLMTKSRNAEGDDGTLWSLEACRADTSPTAVRR